MGKTAVTKMNKVSFLCPNCNCISEVKPKYSSRMESFWNGMRENSLRVNRIVLSCPVCGETTRREYE